MTWSEVCARRLARHGLAEPVEAERLERRTYQPAPQSHTHFPMDHHEFIESGTIGNPLRATAEKGEKAFELFADHVARGIMELMKVPVEVRNREFTNRV